MEAWPAPKSSRTMRAPASRRSRKLRRATSKSTSRAVSVSSICSRSGARPSAVHRPHFRREDGDAGAAVALRAVEGGVGAHERLLDHGVAMAEDGEAAAGGDAELAAVDDERRLEGEAGGGTGALGRRRIADAGKGDCEFIAAGAGDQRLRPGRRD